MSEQLGNFEEASGFILKRPDPQGGAAAQRMMAKKELLLLLQWLLLWLYERRSLALPTRCQMTTHPQQITLEVTRM